MAVVDAKRKHLSRIERWTEKIPRIGMTYAVDAIIMEERGNNIKFTRDQASRVTDGNTGKELYLLKNRDEAMPAAELETIYTTTNGRELLFLHSARKGEYNPVTFNFDGGNVETNIEQAAWNHWSHISQKEERQAWEREEGFWSKYKTELEIAGAGFFFLLLGVGISFALKDMAVSVQVVQPEILLLTRLANKEGGWW